MDDVPLLIAFAPQTSLYRERDLVSQLPIIRNGPAGMFVVSRGGVRGRCPPIKCRVNVARACPRFVPAPALWLSDGTEPTLTGQVPQNVPRTT